MSSCKASSRPSSSAIRCSSAPIPRKRAPSADPADGSAPGLKDEADAQGAAQESEAGEGDEGEWIDLESDASRTEDLDVEPQDAFPEAEGGTLAGFNGGGSTAFGHGAGAASGDAPNLECYVAGERTLKDHLTEQLILAFADPARRLIGHHLIDMTDEAGYLAGDLAGLAELLGAPLAARRGDASRHAGLRPERRVRPRSCANASCFS